MSDINDSPRHFDSLHFDDGLRTIDYILLYHEKSLLSLGAKSKLKTFIENLEELGLEFESDDLEVPLSGLSRHILSFTSSLQPSESVVFLKVYASESILEHFAKAYKIDLEYQNYNYEPEEKSGHPFFNNDLTWPDPNSEIYNRAPDTISGKRPSSITNNERIMVICQLLKDIRFGPNKRDCGIKNLINQGIISNAFPFHDGPAEWTDEGPLNDRQLLGRYWGDIRAYWKKQPLNLINKYYGPEIAFYFAWLGFYTGMLFPMAVLGIISIMYSLYNMSSYVPSDEVCNSDILLCPACNDPTFCDYTPLRASCLFIKLTFLFDNYSTHILMFITSCWAVYFVQKWRQKEHVLRIKWNLKDLETDTTVRKEYYQRTRRRRRSVETGLQEPYVPPHIRCFSVFLTVIACILIMILSMIPITAVVLVKMYLTNYFTTRGDNYAKKTVALILSVIGSTINAGFIQLFGLLYHHIAKYLTESERPRTQAEFEELFIYKRFALSFFNNYLPVIYLAFIKGRFYSYPGSVSSGIAGMIKLDICDPAGCIIDLGIQLFIIMWIKSSIREVLQTKIFSLISRVSKKSNKRKLPKNLKIKPQWIQQYYLLRTSRRFLTYNYLESAIQYGFIVFFGASFPLAFLLAYFNNLHKIRLIATALVWKHRRPMPKRVPGIGAWKTVMYCQTVIGITIQALVSAFISQLVPRIIYKIQVDYSLRGYINSTLSIFDTSDYPKCPNNFQFATLVNTSVCYYPGYRYPPHHPQKYRLTSAFLLQNLAKFIFVFIFEHVLLLLGGLIRVSIPSLPYDVKTKLNIQQQEMKEARVRILNAKYESRVGELATAESKKLIWSIPLGSSSQL